MDSIWLTGFDLMPQHFSATEYQALVKKVTDFQRSVPDLCVSKNFVYKRTFLQTGDMVEDDLAWKLWVPKELQLETHHAPSSGHGSIHKTLSKLRQKLFWPSMIRDVQKTAKTLWKARLPIE